MVVIVFRTRLREGVDQQEMERTGARMYELASGMAGFVSYKDYAAADGEFVSIVEFESLETLGAWRDHPEHREIQARGRSDYFSEYRVQVCTTEREYSFTLAGGRVEGGH
jgi:heme-degrading monooxygenase HmoA